MSVVLVIRVQGVNIDDVPLLEEGLRLWFRVNNASIIESSLVDFNTKLGLLGSHVLVVRIVVEFLRGKLLVLVGSHVVVVSHKEDSVLFSVTHTVDGCIQFVVVPHLRLFAHYSLLQKDVVHTSLSWGVLVLVINFDDHHISMLVLHLRLNVEVAALFKDNTIKSSEAVVFAEGDRLFGTLSDFKSVLRVSVRCDDVGAVLSVFVVSPTNVNFTCTGNVCDLPLVHLLNGNIPTLRHFVLSNSEVRLMTVSCLLGVDNLHAFGVPTLVVHEDPVVQGALVS
jgi:hypothetical protein